MNLPTLNGAPSGGRGARPTMAAANPLADCPHVRAQSRYLDPSRGDLRYRTRPGQPPGAAEREACRALRAHVLTPNYPCVMALSAFNRDAFRLSIYGELAAPGNAAMLCHDLYEFCAEFPTAAGGPVSFVACFEGAAPPDEVAFEAALWEQLQAVHDLDKQHFGWCPQVDSQPDSPTFSFSVGGRAFFLIGMHPQSSRLARRTPMPVLVFNLHEQFVHLRTTGKFDAVRHAVQGRDKRFQGSVNPMSEDFGARSEVAQYSGRAVGRDWVCPFAPQEVSRTGSFA